MESERSKAVIAEHLEACPTTWGYLDKSILYPQLCKQNGWFFAGRDGTARETYNGSGSGAVRRLRVHGILVADISKQLPLGILLVKRTTPLSSDIGIPVEPVLESGKLPWAARAATRGRHGRI